MPIDYQVSEDGRFVRMEAGDSLTADELLDCVRRLFADSAVASGFRLLVDLSRTGENNVTYATLEGIAAVLREQPERRRGGKTAIVTGTSRSFAMSRSYEQLASAEGVDIIVFNSVDIAKVWLGVA